MERGAFLSTWCRTFTHTQKRNMFLAPTLQEGPFHVMLVETNHTQEQKKQKVCDWNHLSLSVTVPAKPTSKRGRELKSDSVSFCGTDENV